MIAEVLSRLSDTPKYQPGMRAYGVVYRVGDSDHRGFALANVRENASEQIRQQVFSEVPEATDYSFKEFDYRAFQQRVIADKALSLLRFHAALSHSDSVEPRSLIEEEN